ncbi:GcrA family cell cycle regulator [Methylobacterium sp. J-090]|uniref:GcrA family cell cycle regulator n=1 Tax=Methylobacterium sp. J-090 TaxID=2836666 RepID=UPI001FBB17BF|nr:GcrA family cell cycle regulator [Methylobacterium sp. J-090]MCJ2079989.1 GcrA cell cycle regulator [Methylobacterium sp. J-090]
MTDTIPSWSDERVDLLRRLWQEGLSASQIAAQLGGVTRNAVIGKVHRLGLSGRVAKGADAALPRKKAVREVEAQETAGAEGTGAAQAAEAGPGAEAGTVTGSGSVIAMVPVAAEATACADPAPVARVEPVALAASRRVTIMDLRESMCRWPLGDPTTPDFHYCGDRAITGLPYCTHHAEIAYQPAAERRRDRRVGGFR